MLGLLNSRVSANAFVLAVQLQLQFLDPPAIVTGVRGTGCPRPAEAGDRILLSGIQLCWIQPLALRVASSMATVVTTLAVRATVIQSAVAARPFAGSVRGHPESGDEPGSRGEATSGPCLTSDARRAGPRSCRG